MSIVIRHSIKHYVFNIKGVTIVSICAMGKPLQLETTVNRIAIKISFVNLKVPKYKKLS